MSCGKCSKPADGRVEMIIPIGLRNGSPIGSCETYAPNLLRDYKNNIATVSGGENGNETFGTSLTSAGDKSKWIIEFYVVGDCGTNTVWKQLYKKGDWSPVIQTINGVEYVCCKLKELPTNSKLSIDMTIYSPCYPCSTTDFYRSIFAKTTEFSGIRAGATPPETITFIGLIDCK